ncbi:MULTISPECIES: TetR/AcrR family transcriptional regulator [unclassified Streptomyces]|uniref:TetR/AcrR family transcriptional regulator n=1 Tax=unclassified Streptomyces TaxID=2593676 RepID=UPI00225BA77F|nr:MULTISPECIES: TetR/AcrR family transcriptional regulator [unclassified Streptomyces]MCX5142805.1 TetR/AcrR family transcriptional regulator [Streptomyces sp. NBC_00338]WSU61249.1 TetR/AcrR family transcriptional regulator [Streptomyces sp. NBC_01104]
MPTARDALLDAAHAALTVRPWQAVRMVDVAAAAGVSRQTLYNEFGSKDGLARALVRRAADLYLAGVERALGSAGGTGDRLAATAAWTVRSVRASALVRGLLTGCWGERLPRPGPSARRTASVVPAQRRADAGPPTPAELLGHVRDRAVAALDEGRPPHDPAALAVTCELALRLALSYALVPPPPGTAGDGVPLVRDVVERAEGAAT